MPCFSGSCCACNLICLSASCMALVMYLRIKSSLLSCSIMLSSFSLSKNVLIVLTAISLATSPAFIPPMPSQQTSSAPSWSSGMILSDSNPQSGLLRLSSRRKLSSLWSRPAASQRAANLIWIAIYILYFKGTSKNSTFSVCPS